MARRVVLHIGTMKTGTTYLQSMLAANRAALDSAGAFYAGRLGRQSAAVQLLDDRTARRREGPWFRLAAKVAETDGVAIYSQEFLSFASPKRVGQIVESFGGTPVDVVLTVRDQRLALPAQWNTYVRMGGTDPWARYLRRVVRRVEGGKGRSRAARTYVRAQNVPAILRRWVGQDGIGTVTVVVLPPSGAPRVELWERFCKAADIDAAGGPLEEAARSNESLGYESLDAVRRLNRTLADLGGDHRRKVRDRLVEPLYELRPEEGRHRLDRAGLEFAERRNDAMVEAIRTSGVALVGSLDELRGPAADDAPEAVEPPRRPGVRRALERVWTVAGLDGSAPEGKSLDAVADIIGTHVVTHEGA